MWEHPVNKFTQSLLYLHWNRNPYVDTTMQVVKGASLITCKWHLDYYIKSTANFKITHGYVSIKMTANIQSRRSFHFKRNIFLLFWSWIYGSHFKKPLQPKQVFHILFKISAETKTHEAKELFEIRFSNATLLTLVHWSSYLYNN